MPKRKLRKDEFVKNGKVQRIKIYYWDMRFYDDDGGEFRIEDGNFKAKDDETAIKIANMIKRKGDERAGEEGSFAGMIGSNAEIELYRSAESWDSFYSSWEGRACEVCNQKTTGKMYRLDDLKACESCYEKAKEAGI